METTTKTTSLRQSLAAFWHSLFLIVPIMIRWFGFAIQNRTLPQDKKNILVWDMISSEMDRLAQNQGLKKMEEKRHEKLSEYIRGRVLDYGCGNGTIAIKYAGQTEHILGMDFSGKMIEAAQKKAKESGIKNVGFLQAVVFSESLKSESFDVVLAWGVLHLLEDRASVAKRIHGLLKKGGIFVSATECMAEKPSMITAFLSFLMKIGIFPLALQYFTVQDLKNTITQAGFTITHAENLADNPVSCFIAAKK